MDKELLEHQLAFLLAISMAESEDAVALRTRITSYMGKLAESDKSMVGKSKAEALLSLYGKADNIYFKIIKD
ncbi:hypothetical protein [Photorhabdus cinerea]|uniref:Uncharacterized protein n=1 Tax=Photorhabdus cinerea TaxID=471575 RepID=A0A7X5QHH2_9GAMM|nr:hypothetical protein [Photorhabdus cinerea]NHB94446.1 hypothetical protein [Photorhabdus cinerea]